VKESPHRTRPRTKIWVVGPPTSWLDELASEPKPGMAQLHDEGGGSAAPKGWSRFFSVTRPSTLLLLLLGRKASETKLGGRKKCAAVTEKRGALLSGALVQVFFLHCCAAAPLLLGLRESATVFRLQLSCLPARRFARARCAVAGCGLLRATKISGRQPRTLPRSAAVFCTAAWCGLQRATQPLLSAHTDLWRRPLLCLVLV